MSAYAASALLDFFKHLFKAQADQYRDVFNCKDGVMTTSSSGGFGDPGDVPPLAKIYGATNGYYARTCTGSVVVAATVSELFAALQSTLAEETMRAPAGWVKRG